jgi:hypothetical protein
MSVLVIKNNNNIIGLYDDLNIALDYVYSLYNSKLITDYIIIEKYKINSHILLEIYNVDLKYNITKTNKINYLNNNNSFEIDSITVSTLDNIDSDKKSVDDNSESDNNSVNSDNYFETKKIIEQYNILGQEKIDIIHNINLLNEQKNRETEKKNIYDSDLILYEKFKLIKNKNNEFEIPELFKKKYDTFQYLESNNKLDYLNFNDIYKPEIVITSFDNLFTNSHTYEKTDNELFNDNDNDTVEFIDAELSELLDINR